jgi:hypothetical protein
VLTWKNLNKLPPTSPSAGIIFELEKEMMIVSFEAVMMIGARRLNSSSLTTIYRSLLLCVSRLLHQIRLNQRALLFIFFIFFFFGFPLPPSALLGYLPNGNNGGDEDNGTWSAWSCVDFLSFWKIEILLMCDFISNRTAASAPLHLPSTGRW